MNHLQQVDQPHAEVLVYCYTILIHYAILDYGHYQKNLVDAEHLFHREYLELAGRYWQLSPRALNSDVHLVTLQLVVGAVDLVAVKDPAPSVVPQLKKKKKTPSELVLAQAATRLTKAFQCIPFHRYACLFPIHILDRLSILA